MNIYVILASFLGTAVEFIEALTIVLAVGITKGWKSSLLGAISSLLVLSALVGIFGTALLTAVNLFYFQAIIGILMLLFGMRWLRKVILRFGGLKAIHDEEEAYNKEIKRLSNHIKQNDTTIEWFGFGTSFNIVFLEGLEAIFIVITFGLAAHTLGSAILGSIIGLVIVGAAGIILRKPLSMISENTMKFIVGLMLTSFGVFWVGEGFKVEWWHADISILIIMIVLCCVSLGTAAALKKRGASA